MIKKHPYSVVCFFARNHGLEGVRALQKSGKYKVACLFTHRKKASFEDPNHGERPEYQDYESFCTAHQIPLHSIDSKEEICSIEATLRHLKEFDFIAVISWRRLIPANQLSMPKIGGVNLHRGKFPEYKGNFPLARALDANEQQIFITAHMLNEEIDGGEILKEVCHPSNQQPSESLDEGVERIKTEITPYFGPLLIDALNLYLDKSKE